MQKKLRIKSFNLLLLFFQFQISPDCTEEELNIMRQAYAGMLWTKQIFIYDVHRWHKGRAVQ